MFDQITNGFKSLGQMSFDQFGQMANKGVSAFQSLGKMGLDAFNKMSQGNSFQVINTPKPNNNLTAEMSAYTASPGETDSRPFETAMQTRAREGIVATNNRDFLGRKVKISGQVYSVEDVMNRRYRDAYKQTGKVMFDIFKNTKEDAFKFGRQTQPYELINDPTSMKRGNVGKLYEELGKHIIKSKSYKGQDDMKQATLDDYPFTPLARNIVKHNSRVVDKSSGYNKKEPPYEASNIEGKNIDKIEVLKPDSNSIVHEFYHTIAQHSPLFKDNAQEFQTAFDKDKTTNKGLQTIDEILQQDTKNYSKDDEKTEERFAYVGELYSGGGLQAFPQNLHQFYRHIID